MDPNSAEYNSRFPSSSETLGNYQDYPFMPTPDCPSFWQRNPFNEWPRTGSYILAQLDQHSYPSVTLPDMAIVRDVHCDADGVHCRGNVFFNNTLGNIPFPTEGPGTTPTPVPTMSPVPTPVPTVPAGSVKPHRPPRRPRENYLQMFPSMAIDTDNPDDRLSVPNPNDAPGGNYVLGPGITVETGHGFRSPDPNCMPPAPVLPGLLPCPYGTDATACANHVA